jgi:SAM-dependent methyltransferase
MFGAEVEPMAINVPKVEVAFERLAETLRAWEVGYDRKGPLRILEAGGGSLSHVTFQAPSEITVVDISPEQLDRNTVATRKILGDLHTVELTQDYDCIVCWDVIEHLDNPGLVMRKLFQAVVFGGIVLLAAPNRSSLAGFITTFTPHWFHVGVMKYVFKSPTAGKPGYPPFASVHHRDIGPDRIKTLARQVGMQPLMVELYESERRDALKRKSAVASLGFELTLRVGAAVTRRPLHASDMILVFQRPASRVDGAALSAAG